MRSNLGHFRVDSNIFYEANAMAHQLKTPIRIFEKILEKGPGGSA